MAFPVYQASQTSSNSTASTTQTVDLPASIVSGEKLIIALGLPSNETATTPSGWTLEESANSSSTKLFIFSRIADGAEGSSVDITTGGSVASIAIAYRIFSNNDTVYSTINTDSSDATPEPSILNPGTTDEYLWLTIILVPDDENGGNNTVSAFPTNFSSNQVNFGVDAGVLDMRIASATYNSEVSSLTPGTWTLFSVYNVVMATIAIEGQDVAVGNFSLLSSDSTILQPAIDFAADASFGLLTSTSQILDPSATTSNKTNWTNESKPSTTWSNEQEL